MNCKEIELIANKYPWVLIENNHDYDYSNFWFFGFDGWWSAFGDQMCQEINRALKMYKCEDEFRILDVKEKYGALRIYIECPSNAHVIYDIIDKYELISENVCMICGKPDIPLIDNGWIQAICKECFNKHHNNVDYEKYIVSEGKIPDSFDVRIYHPNIEVETKTIDIKDTANLIRKRWNGNGN